MKNKKFLTKVKILAALPFFLFAAAAGCTDPFEKNDFSPLHSEDEVFEQPSSARFRTIEDGELTIDDIRLMVSRGEQIYRNIRAHSDFEGTRTYQIPIFN